MKRWLKEPLLHFALLGAVVFAMFRPSDSGATPNHREIVISAVRIEHLATLFARTWQRPPTPNELEGIVEDYIREEVAYREGMAMGLDRDDTIIRRRMRQKFDFVAEDVGAQAEPTDQDLETYLSEHSSVFRLEPRWTFRHIYLNAERRGESIQADAENLLRELRADPSTDPSPLGDPTMLEHAHVSRSMTEIAAQFGPTFAAVITGLQPGEWQGPIASGFGAHLVIVDDRVEGRMPPLDEIRDRVRGDWENARRLKMVEALYAGLLAKYRVTVEWPDAIRGNGGS